MEFSISIDQVTSMAPDASSMAAARKLAVHKHWKQIGQNVQALWGECQGSALYKVRVDITTQTVQCSCPSRKQPCKHGLALLLLTAHTPENIPVSEPPDWIVTWLNKRAALSKSREVTSTTESTATSASKQKSVEKRQQKVLRGLEQLDLWLNDLIRHGLGNLETQPPSFWTQQAAQMVDAQAPGIATRLNNLASIPFASQNWPEKLLDQLGKLTLLSETYQHLDRFDPSLQEELRQLIGWNLKEAEVLEKGEHVEDTWLVLGQHTETVERGLIQRTWLSGQQSGRSAYLLQFAFAGSAFTETYPLGRQQYATLAFWPGAAPQRAVFVRRQDQLKPLQGHFPGEKSFSTFLSQVARNLARNPWQEYTLCCIQACTPIYNHHNKTWHLRDQDNQVLPLSQGEHWKLLALSGGYPIDLASEWNGETLFPLSVMAENNYSLL